MRNISAYLASMDDMNHFYTLNVAMPLSTHHNPLPVWNAAWSDWNAQYLLATMTPPVTLGEVYAVLATPNPVMRANHPDLLPLVFLPTIPLERGAAISVTGLSLGSTYIDGVPVGDMNSPAVYDCSSRSVILRRPVQAFDPVTVIPPPRPSAFSPPPTYRNPNAASNPFEAYGVNLHGHPRISAMSLVRHFRRLFCTLWWEHLRALRHPLDLSFFLNPEYAFAPFFDNLFAELQLWDRHRRSFFRSLHQPPCFSPPPIPSPSSSTASFDPYFGFGGGEDRRDQEQDLGNNDRFVWHGLTARLQQAELHHANRNCVDLRQTRSEEVVTEVLSNYAEELELDILTTFPGCSSLPGRLGLYGGRTGKTEPTSLQDIVRELEFETANRAELAEDRTLHAGKAILTSPVRTHSAHPTLSLTSPTLPTKLKDCEALKEMVVCFYVNPRRRLNWVPDVFCIVMDVAKIECVMWRDPAPTISLRLLPTRDLPSIEDRLRKFGETQDLSLTLLDLPTETDLVVNAEDVSCFDDNRESYWSKVVERFTYDPELYGTLIPILLGPVNLEADSSGSYEDVRIGRIDADLGLKVVEITAQLQHHAAPGGEIYKDGESRDEQLVQDTPPNKSRSVINLGSTQEHITPSASTTALLLSPPFSFHLPRFKLQGESEAVKTLRKLQTIKSAVFSLPTTRTAAPPDGDGQFLYRTGLYGTTTSTSESSQQEQEDPGVTMRSRSSRTRSPTPDDSNTSFNLNSLRELLDSVRQQQYQACDNFQHSDQVAKDNERAIKELGLQDSRYQSADYLKVLGKAIWIMRAVGLEDHIVLGFQLEPLKWLVYSLTTMNVVVCDLDFYSKRPYKLTWRNMVCLCLGNFGGPIGLHPCDFPFVSEKVKLLSAKFQRSEGSVPGAKLSKLPGPDYSKTGRSWPEVRAQIGWMIQAFCDFYGSNHQGHLTSLADYLGEFHSQSPKLFNPRYLADLFSIALGIHFQEVLTLVTSAAPLRVGQGGKNVLSLYSKDNPSSTAKYGNISSFEDVVKYLESGDLVVDYPFISLDESSGRYNPILHHIRVHIEAAEVEARNRALAPYLHHDFGESSTSETKSKPAPSSSQRYGSNNSSTEKVLIPDMLHLTSVENHRLRDLLQTFTTNGVVCLRHLSHRGCSGDGNNCGRIHLSNAELEGLEMDPLIKMSLIPFGGYRLEARIPRTEQVKKLSDLRKTTTSSHSA